MRKEWEIRQKIRDIKRIPVEKSSDNLYINTLKRALKMPRKELKQYAIEQYEKCRGLVYTDDNNNEEDSFYLAKVNVFGWLLEKEGRTI